MLTVVESGLDKIPLARRADVFRMNSSGWDQQMENIKKHVAKANKASAKRPSRCRNYAPVFAAPLLQAMKIWRSEAEVAALCVGGAMIHHAS